MNPEDRQMYDAALFVAQVTEQVNADMSDLAEVLGRCEGIVSRMTADEKYEPTEEEGADLARMIEVRQALAFYRVNRAMAVPDDKPQLIVPDHVKRQNLLR